MPDRGTTGTLPLRIVSNARSHWRFSSVNVDVVGSNPMVVPGAATLPTATIIAIRLNPPTSQMLMR